MIIIICLNNNLENVVRNQKAERKKIVSSNVYSEHKYISNLYLELD